MGEAYIYGSGGGGGGSGGSANIYLTSTQPPYTNGGLWIKTNLTKYSFNNNIQPGLTVTLLQMPIGHKFSWANDFVQLYQYDANNCLKIEMGRRTAPSTSQSSYYYEGCFTTYNIPSQTTTVWKTEQRDEDDHKVIVDWTFSAVTNPFVFFVFSDGIGFFKTALAGSGSSSSALMIINPASKTIVSSVGQQQAQYGFSYFQEANINYYVLQGSNYLRFYNVNTRTYTQTSAYSSNLSNQAIVKNGNNIYCIGAGTTNGIYSTTSYTWTSLPNYTSASNGLGSGYVFKDNICYFRNNNQIIAFNLDTKTFTVTNTIDSDTSTTPVFVGWANYGNNYLLCPQRRNGTANGLYRFTVAGTASSADTVYIITGGNKNYANVVSGTTGAASVPIQGVYTVVNGVLTPFTEAYVSTGGPWTKIVY